MEFYALLLIGAAPWLLLIGGGLYLGARYLRILARRRGAGPSLAKAGDRITELEEAVGRMSQVVNRLSDGQRFTSGLLSSRAGAPEVREQR